MLRRAVLTAFATIPVASARPASGAGAITVFAAASLQDGLRELAERWRADGGTPLRLSFAASSALARQIEQGAPADLFASADEQWMDYLQERGLIAQDTRVSPLANRLVLITPADRPIDLDLRPGVDLAALLGDKGRLAVGDPTHVPAGRYAQQALESLGIWRALQPRLACADNVRAALLLVERGEAPLGIVYATDALASRGVRIAATLPPGSHAPITYPFAVTRRAADNPEAHALLTVITYRPIIDIWKRLGFTVRQE